jgi:hypothetical protein
MQHTGFHPVCLFNAAPQRPELEGSFRRTYYIRDERLPSTAWGSGHLRAVVSPSASVDRVRDTNSPFVLYEVFLWVVFKQPLAGRTAEIEVATVVNAAMPRRGCFHYHTTHRVDSGIGNRNIVLMTLLLNIATSISFCSLPFYLH